MYVYTIRTWRVIDGDSMHLTLDLGFKLSLEVSVRLSGIDTAELRGGTEELKAHAREARDFVERRLAAANERVFISEKLDKYGRALGSVQLDGFDLALDLMEEGLAVPYLPKAADRRAAHEELLRLKRESA